jgi:hypothetical protein
MWNKNIIIFSFVHSISQYKKIHMNFEIFINSFPILFIWKKEIQSSLIENIFEKHCVSIKVDRLVNKHFKTQIRLNPRTLLLQFWSSKGMFNLPPNVSNIEKISQFDKGMHKIWDVWCKGVQCSMMGKWKQIKIPSLRSLIVASLALEYKEVL